MSRLLIDPLTGDTILFAPERLERPHAFDPQSTSRLACPFCPGNESETPPEVARIGSAERWDVRVVPNRYPMVGRELAGVHEVVIESPDHDATFSTLGSPQRLRVLQIYRERFAAIRRNRAVRHIVIFRNEGPRAGQSISHPHSQIVGLPFIPERIRREIALLRSRSRKGVVCPLCADLADDRRRVISNGEFMAVAPDASRFPFQLRLIPTRHAADFGEIDERETAALDEILDRTLRALGRVGDPPTNLIIRSAPLRMMRPEPCHWSIDIVPRLTVEGGFELGTGIPVNILPPEEAAARLRESS